MKLFIPKDLLDFPEIEGLELVRYDQTSDLSDAKIIVGNPSSVFENPSAYPKLKFIQLRSSGYDTVPVEQLNQAGIQVANARGLYSVPIAEYCLGYILNHYKAIFAYRSAQDLRMWDTAFDMLTLEGKSALVLGSGSIGFETAKRLKAFGVRVDGANSDGRAVHGFDQCFALQHIENELARYDIVICTLPANASTHHRISNSFLEAMKPEAFFMNVGRGDVVDEEALYLHLDHLSGVVLDVFEHEPLSPKSVLYTHSKVVITPHISNLGDLNAQKANEFFKENVFKYINGLPVDNLLGEM